MYEERLWLKSHFSTRTLNKKKVKPITKMVKKTSNVDDDVYYVYSTLLYIVIGFLIEENKNKNIKPEDGKYDKKIILKTGNQRKFLLPSRIQSEQHICYKFFSQK